MTYDWHQHTGTPGMHLMQQWLAMHDEVVIRGMAEKWRTIRVAVENEMGRVTEELGLLQPVWTGPAADAFFTKFGEIQGTAATLLSVAPDLENRLHNTADAITTAKRVMPATDELQWYPPGVRVPGNHWEPMADTLIHLSRAEEAAAEGMPRPSTEVPAGPGGSTGSVPPGPLDYQDRDSPRPYAGPTVVTEPSIDTGVGSDAGTIAGGPSVLGPSDTGYPGRPFVDAGYQGRPEADAGYPGRPDTDAGYPGRPDTDAGYPGRPDTDAGYPGRPDIDAGYPGRPDTDAGYPGRPAIDAGEDGTQVAGDLESLGGPPADNPGGGWPGGAEEGATTASGGGGVPGGVGAVAAGAAVVGLGALGAKAAAARSAALGAAGAAPGAGGAVRPGAAPAASASAPTAAATGTGAAAGLTGATAPGAAGSSSATGASGAPMMPMGGGMGGGGGGGGGEKRRRSSWLQEDADVWGAQGVAPGVVDNATP